MRAAFVTCVQLGLACMEEIYAVGGHLDLVVTLPDDRARAKSGRVYVDTFCRDHQIPLLKVPHINDPAAIEAVARNEIDWLCIIGWSQIAGEAILGAPRRGALGMHPTLLPEGRGRAAIPWAILKGLPRTGVTLFKLAPGVDTGPVGAQLEIALASDETATSLYGRVKAAHHALIRQVWPRLIDGTLEFHPQDEARASCWPGRTPADGRLLRTMSIAEVDRLVRASTHPYPGAYMEVGDRVLRVWAGRPAMNDATTTEAPMRLELSDGGYDVLEYEWESVSARA